MSILIKGMEMPKSCSKCKFRKTELEEDPDWCLISGESLFYLAENDCPLIEVPEDVQPVKHGRWILHNGGVPWNVIECSECGEKWHHWQGYAMPNYCSNCGADMREKS